MNLQAGADPAGSLFSAAGIIDTTRKDFEG